MLKPLQQDFRAGWKPFSVCFLCNNTIVHSSIILCLNVFREFQDGGPIPGESTATRPQPKARRINLYYFRPTLGFAGQSLFSVYLQWRSVRVKAVLPCTNLKYSSSYLYRDWLLNSAEFRVFRLRNSVRAGRKIFLWYLSENVDKKSFLFINFTQTLTKYKKSCFLRE